jgi:hypothetical protein
LKYEKVLRTVIALVCLYLIQDCNSSVHLKKVWTGSKSKDLLSRFGKPSAVTRDGKGGKVYIYAITDTVETAYETGVQQGEVMTFTQKNGYTTRASGFSRLIMPAIFIIANGIRIFFPHKN